MLDLDLIRIDGGTQARVELDQSTVAEYAEAYNAGAEFPAVTVFYDGTSRWLADGFHRYFAAKKAGKKSILENIIPGTQRDAIKHSLGANGDHGMRRSNTDKRKSVLTALGDAEWSQLPHKDIAAICKVSREYVSRLASEIEPSCDRSQDTKRTVTRNGKTYEQDTGKIGKAGTPAPAPAPAAPKAKVEPEDQGYFGPSAEEIDAAHAAVEGEMAELLALIAADDKLAEAVETIKRQKLQIAAVESARDGYMNRCNELITRIQTLKRQLKKAEASHV